MITLAIERDRRLRRLMKRYVYASEVLESNRQGYLSDQELVSKMPYSSDLEDWKHDVWQMVIGS